MKKRQLERLKKDLLAAIRSGRKLIIIQPRKRFYEGDRADALRMTFPKKAP